ncbi:hypothetical protein KKG31_06080 [Patescibacteria group bacterium]|nr:hypothetical protein [Patescibacteria group bacterium]MBU1758668.1 hypothetical protein [Patescibacteria group bacterium]
METELIENGINAITRNIELSEEKFNGIYQYNGEKPLLYRGKNPEL